MNYLKTAIDMDPTLTSTFEGDLIDNHDIAALIVRETHGVDRTSDHEGNAVLSRVDGEVMVFNLEVDRVDVRLHVADEEEIEYMVAGWTYTTYEDADQAQMITTDGDTINGVEGIATVLRTIHQWAVN